MKYPFLNSMSPTFLIGAVLLASSTYANAQCVLLEAPSSQSCAINPNQAGCDLPIDTDGDRLADFVELRRGTDPCHRDTDRDLIYDHADLEPTRFNENAFHTTVRSVFTTELSDFESVSLGEGFNRDYPLVFAAMQTTNGGDTASVRVKDVRLDNFWVKVEEEASADSETDHASEEIGFLAVEPSFLVNTDGKQIGETGLIRGVKQEQRLFSQLMQFTQSYENPVVFVQSNSALGAEPAHARVYSYEPNFYHLSMEEWDYQDGKHVSEDVAYIVVEAGSHTLINGRKIQALFIETDNRFKQAEFIEPFNAVPVVLTQSQTRNGERAIVTRNKDVSTSDVFVRLQKQQAGSPYLVAEKVGIIAIEKGDSIPPEPYQEPTPAPTPAPALPVLEEGRSATLYRGLQSRLNIKNAGGRPETCESDNLPAGLTIRVSEDNTCEIIGAPSSLQPSTNVSIKAINQFGSSEKMVDLDIIEAMPFISRWKTDNPGKSANNQIHIPVSNEFSYNFNVDWGDGQTNTAVTESITHTYAEPGEYTVTITGDFPHLHFTRSVVSSHSDALKLVAVEQWSERPWLSMAQAFYNCDNVVLEDLLPPDLSQVKSMRNMFAQTNHFNDYIGDWDVSQVREMSGLFSGARSFNQPLADWDTSAVTNMVGMFADAHEFNQSIEQWDTSSVRKMGGMFKGARAFNQPLGQWDTSHVVDMQRMFNQASNFNQYIGAWDVANVTGMSEMFADAESFNQYLGAWDVSKVTSMFGMFQGAKAFNRDLSRWHTHQVKDMSRMFKGAENFNQPIGLWGEGVANVTNMNQMFLGAERFNTDVSGWNISNVLSMAQMFDGNLSGTHYNMMLRRWSELPSLQSNVTLSVGDVNFTEVASRNRLIGEYSWSIADGGITRALNRVANTSCVASSAFSALRLSETGCYDSAADKRYVDAVVPYDVSSALWSDGEEKTRAFALPDGKVITVLPNGDFDFPVGTILIKQFLDSDGVNHIETRLMMRMEPGWVYASYEWLPDQSDALLVNGTTGKTITVNGQLHTFPSSSQCKQCHTKSVNDSVGLENAQLNNTMLYPQSGIEENQLDALYAAGFINRRTDDSLIPLLAELDEEEYPIEVRAKSYLHSNCASCHRPGEHSFLDFRIDTPLSDMMACNENSFSVQNAKRIQPGNGAGSALLIRVRDLDNRMPPIGTHIEHEIGTALLESWIDGLSGCH